MKAIVVIFLIILLAVQITGVVITYNSNRDIENCQRKVRLELVRIWGGEEKEADDGYLVTPVDLVCDGKGLVYICDQDSHCIKVFQDTGKFVRTIGRKGQGPGDMFQPRRIALTPYGNIMAAENGGQRIQTLSLEGKHLKTYKVNDLVNWLGITSEGTVLMSGFRRQKNTRHAICILNEKGMPTVDFAPVLDKTMIHCTSMGPGNHVHVACVMSPVVRIFTSDGKLKNAFSFARDFPAHDMISVSDDPEKGIEIEGARAGDPPMKITKKDGSVMIQETGKQVYIINGIAVDKENRTYVVAYHREPTEKENRSLGIISSSTGGINRSRVDFDLAQSIEIFELLVFDPQGKIIATERFKGTCDGIRIYNNRLFIMDGVYNQRIQEYKIRFQ